ncbi:hypothetical protein WA026_005778 [Henosepilachna vigintioctopunctata]|uniref:Glycoside hydrolase family 31 TIM barrel domain-containing protein n=1 Tax=Henosepilachna vigintioctopunctata TaxID=420089 RepID=A0AAW1U1X6_9CUCU
METVITYILLLLTFSSSKALDSKNSTQKTYFEKIELNHETRTMKIFNTKGEDIVNARLGHTLDEMKPQSCPTGNQSPGHICLEWERKARLDLHAYELNTTAKCYNFKWTALGGIDSLIDCFQFSDKEHWYGGGQNVKSSFHFDKGFHKYSPFITGRIGDNNWGNLLKRYFISSRGAALLVDDLSPLHTSLNEKQFCLKAQYDDFAFVNHVRRNLELNYTICTSSNTAILHSKLIEDAMWEGLKKQDFENIDTLITEPIWEITTNAAALNEEKISNLGTDIIQLGFLKLGHIFINEFWQKRIGDFTMDPARFSKFENLIHVLHRRGFKIILTIQPFISTESSSFIDAVKKELLISERSCDHRIPALTRYKSLQAAGVLDPTKLEHSNGY